MRRTFAAVQATTKNRVDLGLRLRDQSPGGRLKSGKGVGNGSMTVCLPLSTPADLDREALGWLNRPRRKRMMIGAFLERSVVSA